MPEVHLSEEEVPAVMAYLGSIADPEFPSVRWPAWLSKTEDDMDDEEFDTLFELIDAGQAVWGQARCTICHLVNGPRGEPLGGFVDLRVGGVDLTGGAAKLKRDWLYQWLRDPKEHFPQTLMPRYRFTDEDIRSLVEFILRDPTFLSEEPQWEPVDVSPKPSLVERGKRIIRLSRCVVCHDIEGIPEILPRAEDAPTMDTGFESIAYDVRCLTCHAIDGRGGTYAPDLTTAGSRLRADWIAEFVHSPDFIRPLSQQMPRFNLSRDEAATVASYLGRSRRDAETPDAIPGGPISAREVSEGKRLFVEKGCVACHGTGDVPGGSIGPDLSAVADRLATGYLYQHLRDPHRVNPYSAEPDYALDETEARSLAAFLSKQGKKVREKPSGGGTPTTRTGGWDARRSPEDLQVRRREQARSAFLSRPRTLYLHYCASCHGETGRGDGRLWVTGLTPSPRDLTDASYMTTLDEENLVKIITEGSASTGKSTFCPSWGHTIPAEKIVRLARYVKAFSGEGTGPRTGEASGGEPASAITGEPFPWLLLGIIAIELVFLLRMLTHRGHRRPGDLKA
jgi:mono/diheme cytochrome c family protein